METQELTFKVKFLAQSQDGMGYTNYVFENLNPTNEDDKYLMCVRFPNWNQATFDINDVGFVTIKYVRAGIDKWFDGTDFICYKYTNMIFLKFIKYKVVSKPEEIIID